MQSSSKKRKSSMDSSIIGKQGTDTLNEVFENKHK
jgi:hypothetical protein